ncbi:MAG: copper chaperone CopZ [Dysgonamonadaceae bacterium]|nr:copper chaperone CopZ [Dysgonamonadaceae bacterium]
MKKEILNVEGMSCNHCVNAVNKAVNAMDGVKNVNVDLNAKAVVVEFEPNVVSLHDIKTTIKDLGYDVL